MQKERNLFFIKLSNNFYESDDLTALDDLIIEKELNPAYRYLAIVLYQKLLIKSLEYKHIITYLTKIYLISKMKNLDPNFIFQVTAHL